MHLLSQLTLNFDERRYEGWQNSRWDDITRRTTLERQNYSDLFTHVFTRVLSSQWGKQLVTIESHITENNYIVTYCTLSKLLSFKLSFVLYFSLLHPFVLLPAPVSLQVTFAIKLPHAFRAGPPRTNSHSCNQTRLESLDSSDSRLVDHFQTIGHLNVQFKHAVYIKSFGGQPSTRSESEVIRSMAVMGYHRRCMHNALTAPGGTVAQ